MAEIGIRIVIIDTETIIIEATAIAIDAEAIAVIIARIIEIRRAITPLEDEKIRISIEIKDLGGTLA